MRGICRQCGEAVENHQRAGFRVEGYEIERDQGGQNHVRRKKRVDGEVWHAQCLESHLRRLDGGGVQGALL